MSAAVLRGLSVLLGLWLSLFPPAISGSVATSATPSGDVGVSIAWAQDDDDLGQDDDDRGEDDDEQ
jgi:hypothetical protein